MLQSALFPSWHKLEVHSNPIQSRALLHFSSCYFDLDTDFFLSIFLSIFLSFRQFFIVSDLIFPNSENLVVFTLPSEFHFICISSSLSSDLDLEVRLSVWLLQNRIKVKDEKKVRIKFYVMFFYLISFLIFIIFCLFWFSRYKSLQQRFDQVVSPPPRSMLSLIRDPFFCESRVNNADRSPVRQLL